MRKLDGLDALLIASVAGLGGVAIWYATRPPWHPSKFGPPGRVRTPGPGPGPGPVPTMPRDCPSPGHHIALIGDSHAVGIDPHMKALAKACGTPYTSLPKGGSGAVQWAKYSWLDQVLAAHPTVVIISNGGNNYRDQTSYAPVLASSVETIVGKIRSAGARPIWVRSTRLPWPDRPGVDAMWRAAVGDDWYDSSKFDELPTWDKIHHYPAGYKVWATDVWRTVAGMF